jgi:phasin family protein
MSSDPMQLFGKEGMDVAMSAFNVWTKNAQAIATEVADYSRKSLDGSTAAFQRLISAKSLEKAVEVQSEYLRASCEDMVSRSSKIGELYAGMAREAYKPFEGVLWRSPFAR